MTGWEYDYNNTPVAQTLSIDVNVNAFGGGGFSVGYAFNYYGEGGWYIGSNVHAGELGAGVGINSTVYRYTGKTDWDISILEGDAYYWQAGGTIGPGWTGVDVEYNRTWNKQAGLKGDGIYVGVGASLVPFVNGSVGYSMMDILRIKR